MPDPDEVGELTEGQEAGYLSACWGGDDSEWILTTEVVYDRADKAERERDEARAALEPFVRAYSLGLDGRVSMTGALVDAIVIDEEGLTLDAFLRALSITNGQTGKVDDE